MQLRRTCLLWHAHQTLQRLLLLRMHLRRHELLMWQPPFELVLSQHRVWLLLRRRRLLHELLWPRPARPLGGRGSVCRCLSGESASSASASPSALATPPQR